jgi:hypothetical protein
MCFKTNKRCQYNRGKAAAYEEPYQEGIETTKCKETTSGNPNLQIDTISQNYRSV